MEYFNIQKSPDFKGVDNKKEKHTTSSFKQVFAGSAFLPFTAVKLGEEAEWVNTRMESTFYKYAYVS